MVNLVFKESQGASDQRAIYHQVSKYVCALIVTCMHDRVTATKMASKRPQPRFYRKLPVQVLQPLEPDPLFHITNQLVRETTLLFHYGINDLVLSCIIIIIPPQELYLRLKISEIG